MNPKNMLIPILFALASIILIIFITFKCVSNKGKYKGLRIWILANYIRLFAVILVVISEQIKNVKFNYYLEYFSYVLIIFTFILSYQGLNKSVSKKLNMGVLAAIDIIILMSLTLSIFFQNIPFFVIMLLFAFAYYTLIQVVVVNFKKSRQELIFWSPLTILQSVSLLMFVVFSIIKLINYFKTGICIIWGENDQNFIIYVTVVLTFFNALSIFTTLQNISPNKLEKENYLLRTIFNYSSNINVVVNKNNMKITFASPKFYEYFKFKEEEVIDKMNISDLFYEKNDYTKLLSNDTKYINQKFVKKFINKKSEVLICLVSLTTINFNDWDYYLATVTDITDAEREKENYANLAMYDELTNLPNRRSIFQVFEEKRNNNEDFILLIMDLDNFKHVNDTYGHNAGDEVLKEVGNRLQKISHKADIIARFGGDEFIMLLNLNCKKEINNILEELDNTFVKPIYIMDNPIYIKFSLGISIFPNDGVTFDVLLEKADKELYRKKRSKK